MLKVFVTDAAYKHSVCAIRSLARQGYYVIAASSTPRAQGFYSRACRERVRYPNPRQAEQFIYFVTEYLKRNQVDVLLPIGYSVCRAVSQYRSELAPYTALAIADWDAMQIASDKAKTIAFARHIGIELPRTYRSPAEVTDFPVVVKGAFYAGRVRYVNSAEELLDAYTPDQVIEDYVEGDGYGLCALMNHGEVRACSMHRRIREFPVTGGASTSAETVADPQLRSAGLRLLTALKWHGVAMVEFKREAGGVYKLMEINPKFWGSLELPVCAGVDFPALTAELAVKGDIEPVPDAKPGVRFQWICDDFLHAAAKPSQSSAVFRDLLRPDVNSDFHRDDIRPMLVHGVQTFTRLAALIVRGKLAYPHSRALGRPQHESATTRIA